MIQFYKKNRPLLYSILTGVFYLIYCRLIELEILKQSLYLYLLMFLPGLTFPLATCYFNKPKVSYPIINILVHLIISVAIYYGCVCLYIGKYGVLVGASGSFLFLLETKFLLRKNVPLLHILLGSILSGLVFYRNERMDEFVSIGIIIFLWTLINGLILNMEYRKANANKEIETLS